MPLNKTSSKLILKFIAALKNSNKEKVKKLLKKMAHQGCYTIECDLNTLDFSTCSQHFSSLLDIKEGVMTQSVLFISNNRLNFLDCDTKKIIEITKEVLSESSWEKLKKKCSKDLVFKDGQSGTLKLLRRIKELNLTLNQAPGKMPFLCYVKTPSLLQLLIEKGINPTIGHFKCNYLMFKIFNDSTVKTYPNLLMFYAEAPNTTFYDLFRPDLLKLFKEKRINFNAMFYGKTVLQSLCKNHRFLNSCHIESMSILVDQSEVSLPIESFVNYIIEEGAENKLNDNLNILLLMIKKDEQVRSEGIELGHFIWLFKKEFIEDIEKVYTSYTSEDRTYVSNEDIERARKKLLVRYAMLFCLQSFVSNIPISGHPREAFYKANYFRHPELQKIIFESLQRLYVERLKTSNHLEIRNTLRSLPRETLTFFCIIKAFEKKTKQVFPKYIRNELAFKGFLGFLNTLIALPVESLLNLYGLENSFYSNSINWHKIGNYQVRFHNNKRKETGCNEEGTLNKYPSLWN